MPTKKKPAKTRKPAPLRLEWIDPATLDDNPQNWRTHPDAQLDALEAILDDPQIGWAGVLLFNEQTGRLIDGHARKEKWTARHPGQPAPVLIGSWSEAAEQKILLTHDPIGAMAQANAARLETLKTSVELSDERLAGLRDSLAETLKNASAALVAAAGANESNEPPPASRPGSRGGISDTYKIVLTCRDEDHQTELLDRFEKEGLDARALVG